MAMNTNLSSLSDAWREMGNWQVLTKSKTAKHQWIEEWNIDEWDWPERAIKILYPIKD